YGQSLLTGSSYHVAVDRISAQDAMQHLIADMLRTGEPIHTIVYHGQHSTIIGGVWATGDPVKNPGSITALGVWDPAFGNQPIQASQMAYVSLDTWYTSKVYWATPYDEGLQGAIALDPDPAVGPYTYDPEHGLSAHLWIGNYLYIRPEPANDPA